MSNVLQLEVTKDHAVPVEPSGGSAVATVAAGDSTVYYADNPQVSAASNQGSIAAGGSHTFTAPAWLVSAGLSAVSVTLYPAGSTTGGGPVDVVLGSDGTVGGPGGTALVSSVESAIRPGVTPDGSTVNTTGLQAWINGFTSGGFAHLPYAISSYIVDAPLTITNWTGTLRLDGTIKKAASFTGAAAIVISGGNVKIEAPPGVVIVDGNRSGGAPGDGIDIQGGAVVVIHGGKVTSSAANGILCTGANTDVRTWWTESSDNNSGANTGKGFVATLGAKLRTWQCDGHRNDQAGFYFDRTAAAGCRLDGRAFNNVYSTGGSGGLGASIRSYLGKIGRFEGDSNQGGTIAFEFGGDSWEGSEVYCYNGGNGTNVSGFGVEFYGATRCQIGRLVCRYNAGYGTAFAKISSPLSTTILNGGSGITAGATTIPVAGAGSWPSGGVLLIGSELVTYTGTSGNSFTGCTRGAFNTTAASYADGVTVAQNPASRNNQIGVVIDDNTGTWDNDPAIHFSGGATHNEIGVANVNGRTFAVSHGEGVTPATNDHNIIGLLNCDSINYAIWTNNGGSNNRIDRIVARDCQNASGSYPAMLLFDATSATVTGNQVGSFAHKTDTAPAPTATIVQRNGATGNFISTAGASIERVLWLPGTGNTPPPAISETYGLDKAPANQATPFVSGTLYLVGGLVIAAGTPTVSGTFNSGTTALTMGSNNDGHFWYVLVRASDRKILAVTADAGGATTWAAQGHKTLSWTSSATDSTWANYTPVLDTAVYLGIMIAIGTGGAPVLPSVEGISLGSTLSYLKGLLPVKVGSADTAQTTPPAAGGTTAGLTSTSVWPYAWIS